MAINKNHEFEELNGIKCAIVEKNASQQRVDFLKDLLQLNGFTTVVAGSPPPKTAAPKPAPAEGEAPVADTTPPTPPPPSTYTIGVTDVRFNPTNAIFGRMLKTKDGSIVTLAYWHQKEAVSNDEVPYYDQKF